MGQDKDIVEQVQQEAAGRTDAGAEPEADADDTGTAGAGGPEAGGGEGS